MAYLIGLVRDRFKNHINFFTLFIGMLVFGVLLLDIVGTIIMGFIIHMPISKSILIIIYIYSGDIIKAIIASLIGTTLLNHSRFKNLI